jgi:hypothetical protein
MQRADEFVDRAGALLFGQCVLQSGNGHRRTDGGDREGREYFGQRETSRSSFL